MPTLVLRFPAGRYHATPWGHHVNEGVIEWPPSPWRLLRALLSTGYNALRWPGERPPDDARCLIEKLATTLPCYRLPRASGAHTRHYMPIGVLDKGREKTTLVFDTWAQIGEGELLVHWDTSLSEPENDLLRGLAEHLGYLGRSESWVDVRIAEPNEVRVENFNCVPCGEREHRGVGWEQVPVLVPQTAADYASWKHAELTSTLSTTPALPEPAPTDRKASPAEKAHHKSAANAFKAREAERQRIQATFRDQYPADLFACLQVSTNWLRTWGWSQPPGSRKLFYWRPSNSLESAAPRPRFAARPTSNVEAMMLSMTTSGRNNHALPSVLRTLPQADMLHKALVGAAVRSRRPVPIVLTGRDASGKPMRGPHEHAHILPLDLDCDGHIDHLLIWAPMGLCADAQAAIRSVRKTFTKGGVGPLQLAVATGGSLQDLDQLRNPQGSIIRAVLAPQGATTWISLTPFIAPRHIKTRGANTLESQVVAELAVRGFPAPREVQSLDLSSRQSFMRFRHYIRTRSKGPQPAMDFVYALRLSFETPQRGPITLGYGAHFGLGMFTSSDPGQ